MYKTKAYSLASATSPLTATTIPRREPTDRDVQIEILFCGICHSDLHYARDEWHDVLPAVYPCVPGHEIVGRVTKVGSAVAGFKQGDFVGVGCLVDSDGTCPHCKAGMENFCRNQVLTYGGPDRHKTAAVTYGGYSGSVVVDEHFVLRIPSNLSRRRRGPTAVRRDHDVFAPAPLGSHKGEEGRHRRPGRAGTYGCENRPRSRCARRRLHARRPARRRMRSVSAPTRSFSRNADEMKKQAGSFDFILDAVSADHDINAYINLLAIDGNLTLVGAPAKPLAVGAFPLIMGRRSLSGSIIGGITETQEMLDFCGRHNITADVEVIPIQKINEAWERMVKSDVKYRFSIDMASLKAE